jgi:MFS family permease
MRRDPRTPVRRSGPFPALRHRNFRLFLIGQGVSIVGTWMQATAQAWLVLTLTNSSFLLGAVSALQWLPVTVLGVVGGAMADRLPKRRLLIITQATLMAQALVLALLSWTGVVRYWHVAVLAGLLGLVNSFDMPTRQAFFVDMVAREDLMNAIALNSALTNVGRVLGPAVSGLIIASSGVSAAFLLNGVSFLAVIAALAAMTVRPPEPIPPRPLVGHIKEGLAYVRGTPSILTLMVLLAAISTFVLNFSSVLVPVMARAILGGSAHTFGLLMSALGAGSFLGAITLAAASRRGPDRGLIHTGAVVVTLMVLVLGFVRTFYQAATLLFVAGFSMIVFSATANSFVQALAPDHLLGRVMSIYSVLWAGITPVGALLIGGIMDLWGPRAGFVVGGSLGLLSIVVVTWWSRRLIPRRA